MSKPNFLSHVEFSCQKQSDPQVNKWNSKYDLPTRINEWLYFRSYIKVSVSKNIKIINITLSDDIDFIFIIFYIWDAEERLSRSLTKSFQLDEPNYQKTELQQWIEDTYCLNPY